MNKINYSSLLVITMLSQQALAPLKVNDLRQVATALGISLSDAEAYRGAASIADAIKMGQAKAAQAKAAAQPAPAATPPVPPVSPSVSAPKAPAPQPAPTPAPTNAGISQQLAALQAEVNQLRADKAHTENNLQAERQSHEVTKSQLREARKVADAVANMKPEDIAGAALALIQDAGFPNATETAGSKQILNKLKSAGRQSHTLGRLGSAHKQNQKRNNRYAY